jgi:uncharacterized protein YbjQ (UPF0145 family)
MIKIDPSAPPVAPADGVNTTPLAKNPDSVILTTEPTLPEYRALNRLGVIYVRVKLYNNNRETRFPAALDEMRKKAAARGADAVVALQASFSDTSIDLMGTAVTVIS